MIGFHEQPPNDQYPSELRNFGNLIGELLSASSSEATVDLLARFLINICNPDRFHLHPISKMTINTSVRFDHLIPHI
jgi:hypothetical protein